MVNDSQKQNGLTEFETTSYTRTESFEVRVIIVFVRKLLEQFA